MTILQSIGITYWLLTSEKSNCWKMVTKLHDYTVVTKCLSSNVVLNANSYQKKSRIIYNDLFFQQSVITVVGHISHKLILLYSACIMPYYYYWSKLNIISNVIILYVIILRLIEIYVWQMLFILTMNNAFWDIRLRGY